MFGTYVSFRLVKSHRNFYLEAHCQVVSAGNKGPQIPQGTVRAASKGAHGVCLDAIHRYTVYTVLDVAIPCRAQLKSHHFLNINIILCCFFPDFFGLCMRMYCLSPSFMAQFKKF